VVALALGGVGYALWPHRVASEAAAGGPDPRRIAVLYFRDQSSDGALRYLADGLTEALINRLSTVPQLVVTSSGGSEMFHGSEVPRDSIARALGVGTLVEGSLDRAGDEIKVSVKMEDASGADLRRATFGMPASRPIALKDTLAGQVARFLRERLGQAIELRAERAGTSDQQAWDLLQHAKRLQRDGDSARIANDTATMLRKFAEADSTLAIANRSDPRWAAIPILRGTIRYWTSRFYSSDQLLARAWIDSGLIQAAHALREAPENADALQLRGELRYWRWLMALEPDPIRARALLDSARKDLETATQLSANQPEAWSILSHLYYQYGDVAGAKLAAQRAYNEDAYLKGVNLIVWRLFTTSYDLEQFPDAIHWCDTGAGRFPADPRFVECKLWIMGTGAVKVDPAAPWMMVDSMVRLSAPPDRPYAKLHGVALAAGGLFRAGLRDSAAHLLDQLDDRADVDPTRDVSQYAALVWASMGNAGKAVARLELYLSANPARAYDFDAEDSWGWRTIRDDPRFQALTGHKQH
jgi:serine/threonine-protein kinase